MIRLFGVWGLVLIFAFFCVWLGRLLERCRRHQEQEESGAKMDEVLSRVERVPDGDLLDLVRSGTDKR